MPVRNRSDSQRGAAFVGVLVVIAILVLGLVPAAIALRDRVADKAQVTGEKLRTMETKAESPAPRNPYVAGAVRAGVQVAAETVDMTNTLVNVFDQRDVTQAKREALVAGVAAGISGGLAAQRRFGESFWRDPGGATAMAWQETKTFADAAAQKFAAAGPEEQARMVTRTALTAGAGAAGAVGLVRAGQATATAVVNASSAWRADMAALDAMATMNFSPGLREVRTLAKGEKWDDVAAELAARTRATQPYYEHGLYAMHDGRRVIYSGNSTNIQGPPGARRIMAHTHPNGVTDPSSSDRYALWSYGNQKPGGRGQQHSYIVPVTPKGHSIHRFDRAPHPDE